MHIQIQLEITLCSLFGGTVLNYFHLSFLKLKLWHTFRPQFIAERAMARCAGCCGGHYNHSYVYAGAGR